MKICPSCGAQNHPEQPACAVCGTALAPPAHGQTMVGYGGPPAHPAPAPQPSAAAAPQPNPFKGTMLGLAPGESAPMRTPAQAVPAYAMGHSGQPAPVVHAPAAYAAPAYPDPAYGHGPPGYDVAPPPPTMASPVAGGLKSTMLGVAPAAPPAAAPQQPQLAGASLKGTMIGVAPLDAAHGGSAAYPPPAQPYPPAANLAGTMVGVPKLADGHAHGTPAPQPGLPVPPAHGVPQQTMLGVGMLPDAASFHPGAAAPAPRPPYGPSPGPTPPYGPSGRGMGAAALPVAPVSQPASSVHRVGGERIVDDPRPAKRKRRIPLGAALTIVGAAALSTAAVVAFLLYDSRGALVAQVALDGEGRERLELACDACSDASIVRLGNDSAQFRAQRAALVLSRPLAIGENRLTLDLERAPGKSERVELTVPVEYRVRGDASALEERDPHLRVMIQAIPGTTAVVEGKPVKLDAEGSGSATIDVTSTISGQDASVRRLERRIAYAITPPGSPTHSGEVAMQLGVAALTIDAPGESVVIDSPTFVLAGRTLKGATVSVEGRPITVDASGKFAQMMNVSAQGETTVTVRAAAPDHAPRLVPIRIKRVDNLSAELARAREGAVTSYGEIAADAESKRGVSVAFEGTVLEARTENFATIVLVDVKSGCADAPCLCRVSYGAKARVASGDAVTVIGRVIGAVDGPRQNTRVPAVSAEFVVKAGK